MKVFDAGATASLLPYVALVPAVRQAMLDLREGLIRVPQRIVLPLPDGGTHLTMPASDSRFTIAKLVSVTPANRRRGLPTLHGIVIVSDARSGETLCALDGPTVTARRTAAVTMLGVETLLGRRPTRIALVGTGTQARTHALAMQQHWSPDVVWAVGRTIESARAFAEELRRDGVPATASELSPALADGECIVCLTTSRRPILPPTVSPDTLVVGVGAFTPDMAELPPELVRARRVVVDDAAGAREEAGDLIQAGVDWERVTELADHLSHARADAPDVVLKTVGNAAWDLAAARAAVGGIPSVD